ncbi:ABC transporter substrate-binding protein [Streptomyces albus]|uniref:Peptide-binding protein n=1 Tax=Streptomyces albus TaxID=1888 RepID=A0A8H1QP01_9ACTN|nr:ABC transporter substrate-binding protein [Streptomyces albus]TGG76361.1 peptide-binding protein [Streptomyces albus]UVN58103.1 ABC transporter substrate-binding protein [Streptomyces albus]
MFDRNGLRRAAATILPLALVAGCGALPGSGSQEKHRIVVGTTSAPSSLDPAAAWDGSWELYRNIYQTLMAVPNTGTSPEPDAARSCRFSDAASRVYRCVLREGLKFSSGRPLDADAVKHSFDRTTSIKSPSGPAALLDNLDEVRTRGKRTVVFRLKKPDATFPFVLSTPAASLVDPQEYPGATLHPDDTATGSGPYTLRSYRPGKEAVLVKNPDYKGPAELRNDSVTIRYYTSSRRMVDDLKAGRIDLTYRGLTPRQISAFQDAGSAGDDAVQLSEMTGSEVHFLVFNPKDAQAAKPAVRRAVAQLVDRKELVRDVHDRTADPLYSMVPTGVTGHTNAFLDRYGQPSEDKARAMLQQAGITTPVPLTLWYARDRYGDSTQREFAELKAQLERSGLFEITLRSRSWASFQKGYLKGAYPVFGRGWSADFPDADNYIAPFVGDHNAMGTPYRDRELTGRLLPTSRKQSDRGAAGQSLGEAQRRMARDARLLPLWQGKVYIASEKDVAGIEWAVDSSVIMRMWELYKKSSW